jgi:hypothetical protein
MFKILLVGSGNLGIRYLEGLALFPELLEIFVLDPQKVSLLKARKIWDSITLKSSHNIEFIESYNELPSSVELCIVATTADVRLNVVQLIQKKLFVGNWVLEKVLTQSVEDLFSLRDTIIKHDRVWVNLPRRMMIWHKSIKDCLLCENSLKFHLAGGNWGLACNAIHFIDLVSWWTESDIIEIDSSHLKEWYPSKRKNFWEISGKIVIYYSDDIYLELNSNRDKSTPMSLKISSKSCDWVLNESEGNFYGPNNFTISGEIEYQSSITSRLIKNILIDKDCELPLLDYTINAHELLLSQLLKNWNLSKKISDTHLPIT